MRSKRHKPLHQSPTATPATYSQLAPYISANSCATPAALPTPAAAVRCPSRPPRTPPPPKHLALVSQPRRRHPSCGADSSLVASSRGLQHPRAPCCRAPSQQDARTVVALAHTAAPSGNLRQEQQQAIHAHCSPASAGAAPPGPACRGRCALPPPPRGVAVAVAVPSRIVRPAPPPPPSA